MRLVSRRRDDGAITDSRNDQIGAEIAVTGARTTANKGEKTVFGVDCASSQAKTKTGRGAAAGVVRDWGSTPAAYLASLRSTTGLDSARFPVNNTK